MATAKTWRDSPLGAGSTPSEGPWTFILTDVNGRELQELTQARARTLGFQLRGGHSLGFNINGRHPEAALIKNLQTDIAAYRGNDFMFRGRITNKVDTITTEAHNVAVSATSYNKFLDVRIVFNDTNYTSYELVDMAWSLISISQTTSFEAIHYGGDLGITQGVIQLSGTNTDPTAGYTVKQGTTLAAAIDSFSNVVGGFDWDILPHQKTELLFTTWGQRGDTQKFVTDINSTAKSVTRTESTQGYVNLELATGSTGTSPAESVVTDLNTRTEGRIEKFVAKGDITDSVILQAATDQDIAMYGNIVPTYVAVLAPGQFSPDKVWLGDLTKINAASGYLTPVDVYERVGAIGFTLSDDGDESVQLTYGTQYRTSLNAILKRMGDRLDQLERF